MQNMDYKRDEKQMDANSSHLCCGCTHGYVIGVDVVWTFVIVHRDQLHPTEVILEQIFSR